MPFFLVVTLVLILMVAFCWRLWIELRKDPDFPMMFSGFIVMFFGAPVSMLAAAIVVAGLDWVVRLFL